MDINGCCINGVNYDCPCEHEGDGICLKTKKPEHNCKYKQFYDELNNALDEDPIDDYSEDLIDVIYRLKEELSI